MLGPCIIYKVDWSQFLTLKGKNSFSSDSNMTRKVKWPQTAAVFQFADPTPVCQAFVQGLTKELRWNVHLQHPNFSNRANFWTGFGELNETDVRPGGCWSRAGGVMSCSYNRPILLCFIFTTGSAQALKLSKAKFARPSNYMLCKKLLLIFLRIWIC